MFHTGSEPSLYLAASPWGTAEMKRRSEVPGEEMRMNVVLLSAARPETCRGSPLCWPVRSH